MIIHSKLTEGQTEIDCNVEIEQDCLSFSFNQNSICINICLYHGKLTAHIYAQNGNDPEVINLTTA